MEINKRIVSSAIYWKCMILNNFSLEFDQFEKLCIQILLTIQLLLTIFVTLFKV